MAEINILSFVIHGAMCLLSRNIANFWLKYRVKLILKNINFSSISNA